MKQTAILTIQASVEKANDGSYWCYTPASVSNCVLSGCGKTPQAAIDDMIDAYNEVKEMNEEEGISTPEVSLTFKYDIPSFFAQFDSINVAQFAKDININSAQLRRYINGGASAGEAQRAKINNGIKAMREKLELTIV